MKSKVCFVPASLQEGEEAVGEKALKAADAAGLLDCFAGKDFAAVKIHAGESGNITYLPPRLLKNTVEALKERGAKPFFTDTSTLYRGQRSNAVDHSALSEQHGFTVETAGAPFFPADGLYGDSEVEVRIKGKLYKSISVARDIHRAQAILLATHATGHPASGLGGAIKNLGMGCTSRKGKRKQHCELTPGINSNCVACGECAVNCPVGAISIINKRASIDSKACIGCGQCLAVCRYNAVTFDWGVKGSLLQKRMAEHALGVLSNKRRKTACLTFVLSVSDGCDCMGTRMGKVIPDYGIMASVDPVAIDQAVLDMIPDRENRSISELIKRPSLDPTLQVKHGAEIGLGSMEYELIQV